MLSSSNTALLRSAPSSGLAPAPGAGRPSRSRLMVSSIFKLGGAKKEEPAVDRKGRPIKPAPAPKAPKEAAQPKRAAAPAAAPVKAKPVPPPRTAGKGRQAAEPSESANGARKFSLFGGGKAEGTQKAGTGPSGSTRRAAPAPAPAKTGTQKAAPAPRTAGKARQAAEPSDSPSGTRIFSLFGGVKTGGTQTAGTGPTGTGSTRRAAPTPAPTALVKAKPVPPARTAGKGRQAAEPSEVSTTRTFSLFGGGKTEGTQKAGTGPSGTGSTRRAAPAPASAKTGTQKAAPAPRSAGKPAAATGSQRVGSQRAAAATTGSSTRRVRGPGPSAPAAAAEPAGPRDSDQEYLNITGYPFPLGPFLKRPTIRKELIKGVMWGFEQPQSLGGSNVTTNIRMTIVRLESGGLWVHAPIAPTRECVRMVKQLEKETGEAVQYIVLPTFGYEHKIFVGPFSRRFPKAQVWVAPSQWSWPINLPPQFFGIFPTGELRSDAADTPWAGEIEQKVFESSVGIGPYIEAAFFHKKTCTLLVTDAVISVPSNPPELVPEESLLEAAARNFFINVLSGKLAQQPVDGVPLVPTELTPAARALGWRRMALQILYIVPGDLRDPSKGFQAVAERLIVGPILKTLVFSTTPEKTREWVDSICADWDFSAIIPAHFSAPVRAGPSDFKAAFSFAYEPQLSQERAAAAAAEAEAARGSSKQAAAAAALEAARKEAAKAAADDSANPAKALDGVLVGLLGGLNVKGSSSKPAPAKKNKADKAEGGTAAGAFSYPAEDIKALNAARRFLVSAGVVNK